FKFNLGASTVPLYLDNIRVIDRSATSVQARELPLAGGVREYELHQAFPNPFNMITSIRFTLAQEADVRMDVYNMAGQKVRTLATGAHLPGTHTVRWNGEDDRGHAAPSGVYVCRLTSLPNVDLSRKLLLLK
ncbi:T9SS type A sorting domain-containing protein, partial [candidate division KSB1 bacterium]|nr:T9SS type A sorting domain-containing protein [candidate division KSB1 bacterium]